MPPEHEVTGSNPVGRVMDERRKDRLPRGAIAVVAIGVFASILAAVLTNENLSSADTLPWAGSRTMASTKAVPLGPQGSIRLLKPRIFASKTNIAGYTLFMIETRLALNVGRYDGRAAARCSISAPLPATNAQTPNQRAAYPRPSENLDDQSVTDYVVAEFAARGGAYSAVDTTPGENLSFVEYSDLPGTELLWETYLDNHAVWDWLLPEKQSGKTAKLGFFSLFRTTERLPAKIECTAAAGDNTAKLSTKISMTPVPGDTTG